MNAPPLAPGRELVSASAWLAEARELAGEGRPIDAGLLLSLHPELAGNKDVVLDLAYEEFCQRREAGEPLEPAEFAARFPRYRTSLGNLLAAHQFLEGNSHLLPPDLSAGELRPGDSFIGFRLVRELGRGSFGRVFLATETALGNRPVAVKISWRGSAEAETLGRLRHENIVPVHSAVQDPATGMTVVCMPLLGRATLCDVLDGVFSGRGFPRRARAILEACSAADLATYLPPSPPPHPLLRRGSYVDGVLHLGAQLAGALAFAHAQKIFHRDLKPSNVLLSPDGRPLLLDFNLSFDGQRSGQPLGGTLPYMSPEQLRATDPQRPDASPAVDGRSDLFSVGVILYELLAGAHPFGPLPQGGPPEKVRNLLIERQARGARPLHLANPRLDRGAARVVERCLAGDPGERFQSAADLEKALRQCLAPVPRGRRWVTAHARKIAVGVLAAVACASLAVGYLLSGEPYEEIKFREGVEAYRRGDYLLAARQLSHALEGAREPARILFARGRAHQKAGLTAEAYQDFRAADRLEVSGKVKACLGYCYTVGEAPDYPEAVVAYNEALRTGLETAAVHHNLGYCYLKIKGKLEEAGAHFQKARRLNPGIQAAHYLFAVVELERRNRNPRHSLEEGLAAIQKAAELKPEHGKIFWDAARQFALAGERDPALKDRAVQYAQKAVEQGIHPQQLKQDFLLAHLREDPRFQTILRENPVPPRGFQLALVLDPLEEEN